MTEAWTADPHIASFWKTSVKETAEEPELLLTALCSNICNEGYGPSPVQLIACSPDGPMEMTWREPGQVKRKALEDILLEGLFINGVLTRRVKDTINEQTFGMRSQTKVDSGGLMGILNTIRIPFIPFPYRPIPILSF